MAVCVGLCCVLTPFHQPTTGIQAGLRSFADQGVHPKWLIIDDGWQLTDVDAEFRTPPTAKLLQELGLVVPEAAATADAFVEAELEVLSQVAKQVPQSTSAGGYRGCAWVSTNGALEALHTKCLPGAVLEEVSHLEVAPSDMKRLMDGQMGSVVQQRHSMDGEDEKKNERMVITGDERAQVFVFRCALCCTRCCSECGCHVAASCIWCTIYAAACRDLMLTTTHSTGCC